MKLINKKTGEILEDVKFIDTSLTTIELRYLDNGVLRIKTEKDYHSFLQNWRDYEQPKEPLIKDEKIRKAVRAWAEANEISQAQFDRYISGFSASDDEHNILSMISFDGFVFMFVDGKIYTIDELCGEEKE